MSGNGELMVGPEDIVVRPDEVATRDPMKMSQMMSLDELMKAQNEYIEHLEKAKKDISESLATKVTEADEAKKALARELGLSAEKTNALVVAKVKQEELEKELGARQKSEEERRVAREKTIEDRMFEAILLARTVVLRQWKNKHGRFRSLASDPGVHGETGVVDDYEKLLGQFAFKIYDELKAAEEAEKEKEKPKRIFSDAEIKVILRRAAAVGEKDGQSNEIDAAMSAVAAQRMFAQAEDQGPQ